MPGKKDDKFLASYKIIVSEDKKTVTLEVESLEVITGEMYHATLQNFIEGFAGDFNNLLETNPDTNYH